MGQSAQTCAERALGFKKSLRTGKHTQLKLPGRFSLLGSRSLSSLLTACPEVSKHSQVHSNHRSDIVRVTIHRRASRVGGNENVASETSPKPLAPRCAMTWCNCSRVLIAARVGAINDAVGLLAEKQRGVGRLPVVALRPNANESQSPSCCSAPFKMPLRQVAKNCEHPNGLRRSKTSHP
jgi:hypothetical protein